MGLFTEGVDTVDIPDLQRKGIVKKSKKQIKQEQENAKLKADKDGFIEFSGEQIESEALSAVSSYSAQAQQNRPNAEQEGGGDIFSSLAQASSSNNTSFFGSESKPDESTNLEVQHLKVKIDDLEYKINELMDKIAKLEMKIAGK